MFQLVTERGKYLKIRENVNKNDVMEAFSMPVDELYCGKIIEVTSPRAVYRARIGDTYESIAGAYGVSAEKLKELNSDAALYPTKAVWIP